MPSPADQLRPWSVKTRLTVVSGLSMAKDCAPTHRMKLLAPSSPSDGTVPPGESETVNRRLSPVASVYWSAVTATIAVRNMEDPDVVRGTFADQEGVARAAAGLVNQGRGARPVGIVEHGLVQRLHDALERVPLAHVPEHTRVHVSQNPLVLRWPSARKRACARAARDLKPLHSVYRKRPFAIHRQRRRPASTLVCRIPCLILCLADVARTALPLVDRLGSPRVFSPLTKVVQLERDSRFESSTPRIWRRPSPLIPIAMKTACGAARPGGPR